MTDSLAAVLLARLFFRNCWSLFDSIKTCSRIWHVIHFTFFSFIIFYFSWYILSYYYYKNGLVVVWALLRQLTQLLLTETAQITLLSSWFFFFSSSSFFLWLLMFCFVFDVIVLSWYFGPMLRQDATDLLMAEKEGGVFLVRDSMSIMGDFVLCVR